MLPACEICGLSAHGNHFGVLSCRACAAFFRRAAANPSKANNVSCAHGPCTIYENGHFSCKKCRLKRCLDRGMDPSKFQLDRDLISSSVSPQLRARQKTLVIPQTLATFLGRPSFLIFCDPEAVGTIKTVVDCTYLIDKATEILKAGQKSCKPYGTEMSSLEKISASFESLRLGTSSEPHFIRHLGKEHTVLFWEQEFLNTADWLTNFDEFNTLPLPIRVDILKGIWTAWAKLDKLAKTAEYRRKKVFMSDRMWMVGDDACLDAEKTDVDVSWFTDYSREQLSLFMNCYFNANYQQIVEELMDFQPTSTELNFMLLQLCLQQAAKRLDGDVANEMDRLQDVISNQLHNYYVRARSMPNYSGRVTRMMKINNLMRRDLWEQNEKKQLAMVFNVFSLTFSHPEMMC
ncbi:unnamed protein product [Caenorhabditis sp. 36 PRJEB53466]|nr:unnamed protein product [Caenorhabditis sp. 36 PRJEB53466]